MADRQQRQKTADTPRDHSGVFPVQLTLLLQKVADLLLAQLSNGLHIAVVLQQGKDVIGQDISIGVGTEPPVSRTRHSQRPSANTERTTNVFSRRLTIHVFKSAVSALSNSGAISYGLVAPHVAASCRLGSKKRITRPSMKISSRRSRVESVVGHAAAATVATETYNMD